MNNYIAAKPRPIIFEPCPLGMMYLLLKEVVVENKIASSSIFHKSSTPKQSLEVQKEEETPHPRT